MYCRSVLGGNHFVASIQNKVVMLSQNTSRADKPSETIIETDSIETQMYNIVCWKHHTCRNNYSSL